MVDSQPGAQQAAHLQDGRVVALDVADLDADAALAGGGDDRQRVFDRGGERLLDEDRQAALDGRQGQRQVGGRRRGDDDAVQLGRRIMSSGSAKPSASVCATAASRAAGSGSATAARIVSGWFEMTRRWLRPIEPRPARPSLRGALTSGARPPRPRGARPRPGGRR